MSKSAQFGEKVVVSQDSGAKSGTSSVPIASPEKADNSFENQMVRS